MTEKNESTTDSNAESEYVVVTIPEHLTERVIAYVKELEHEDDTTANMMNLGVGLGSSQSVIYGHTMCKWSTTNKGKDLEYLCGD